MEIRIKSIAMLLGALAFQMDIAHASERVVIYPTGIFPTDVENIQAAVNQLGAAGRDGAIILKAHNMHGVPTAFNFQRDGDPSERGSVLIDAAHSGAIEFRGENDDSAQTTISGGNTPIRMERRDRLTVRNIVFQAAFRSAIRVEASTNAVIKDNVLLDTVGFQDTFPLTRVIAFVGSFLDPDQITGEIIIEDNIIDKATAGFSDGITTFSTNADTWITGNYISGVNVGVRHNAFAKALYLTDNHLAAHVPAPLFFAAGAQVGCDIGDEAFALIADNHVTVVDQTLQGEAVGVALAAFNFFEPDCDIRNTVVAGNEISTVNGVAGAQILAALEGEPARAVNNVIADNEFRGNSLFGIFLGELDSASPDVTPDIDISNNLIIGNDFETLQSAEADILLDEFTSNNRVVIEEEGTVIDDGVNNVVTIGDDDDDDGDSDED